MRALARVRQAVAESPRQQRLRRWQRVGRLAGRLASLRAACRTRREALPLTLTLALTLTLTLALALTLTLTLTLSLSLSLTLPLPLTLLQGLPSPPLRCAPEHASGIGATATAAAAARARAALPLAAALAMGWAWPTLLLVLLPLCIGARLLLPAHLTAAPRPAEE